MKNELEQKPGYRLYKVVAGFILILSFFAPLFIRSLSIQGNISWVLGGIINLAIWWVILFLVIKWLIYYVVYGSKSSVSDVNQVTPPLGHYQKRFSLEESWLVPFVLIGISSIIGFSLNSSSQLRGALVGAGVGVVLLIAFYVVHELVKTE
jgi:hypothetical protein